MDFADQILCGRPGLKRVVGVILFASLVGVVCAQKPIKPLTPQNQQVTGFRVPSYDDQNNLTSTMFGESAMIMPDGKVDITDLRLEFYSGVATNRQIEMRVTSPRCMYDRNTGSATSDAPVRLARDNMVVTGVGFQWSSREEKLFIEKDAKVVFNDIKRSMREQGVAP